MRRLIAVLMSALLVMSITSCKWPVWQKPQPTAPSDPVQGQQSGTEVKKREHILIFSDEDKQLGLDKTLKYTEEELKQIDEAEKSLAEGKYKEADDIYSALTQKTSAWQRDPLLLVNWGMVQMQLGRNLDAKGKFQLAVEKANGNDELKEDLLACLNELTAGLPDTDEYRETKRQVWDMLYELDKSNISVALQYVLNGLDVDSVDLRTAFGILEDINAYGSSGGNAANKWNGRIKDEDLAAGYLKLASVCLSGWDARENVRIIKTCIERASALSSGREHPFLLYAKGLIKQHEGDMQAAIAAMNSAIALAPGNMDIELWLKANTPPSKQYQSKSISLSQLGVDASDFRIGPGDEGIWLDDGRVLVIAYKYSNGPVTEKLLLLDINSLECREVYRGESIYVHFLTPDGKHVAFSDKSLKLLNLETGQVTDICETGYFCSLSPDCSTIAYTDKGIWLYNISDGSKKKIDDGRDDGSPIWFPDGKSILFIGDLGGEELGDGAGHLQSIFKMTVSEPYRRESILPDWKSKFHYVKWIKPGELVYVAEGWDDGFLPALLDLKTKKKVPLGGQYELDHSGLYFNPQGGSLFMKTPPYIKQGNTIVRLDTAGKATGEYRFGNVSGYGTGVRMADMDVLADERVLFFYGTHLEEKQGLWLAGPNLENPVMLTQIKDATNGAYVSPSGRRVLVRNEKGKLFVADIK